MWAEALRTSPGRETLRAEAELILGAWPADPPIVLAVCDALLRLASRRAFDEPPEEGGPATLAAEAAGRCLSRLEAADRQAADPGGMLLATRGNALRKLGPGRRADAVEALEAAIALEPRGEWELDLSIVHKEARAFDRALEHAGRARAALGERKGVLWNLAIAATACGDSEAAAEAWRALGLSPVVSEGALPRVDDLPPAQVRLPTLGPELDAHAFIPEGAVGFEAVWVQPLSPCHGVVRSPTHREARADFGDVVLWDGAPVAFVERDGAPIPRFPVLTVLWEGDERRFRFLAMQQEEGQVEALATALPSDVVLYSHGERVEVLCPRCAAGDTFTKHEHLPAEEHRIVFGKLIVPAARELREVADALSAARREHAGVLLALPGLFETLGDTADAGKHHKRWGAIERAAARPR